MKHKTLTQSTVCELLFSLACRACYMLRMINILKFSKLVLCDCCIYLVCIDVAALTSLYVNNICKVYFLFFVVHLLNKKDV